MEMSRGRREFIGQIIYYLEEMNKWGGGKLAIKRLEEGK
jgi:hypothetical protein